MLFVTAPGPTLRACLRGIWDGINGRLETATETLRPSDCQRGFEARREYLAPSSSCEVKMVDICARFGSKAAQSDGDEPLTVYSKFLCSEHLGEGKK